MSVLGQIENRLSTKSEAAFLNRLNLNEMNELKDEIFAHLHWKNTFKSHSNMYWAKIRKLNKRVKKLISSGKVPLERTESGAVLHREHAACLNQESFFDVYIKGEGWEILVSESYSHTWSNERLRKIISYCEGDVYVIDCETQDIYNREVMRIFQYHINDS